MRLYYEIWADALEAIKNSKSYMPYKDKIVIVFLLFVIAQGFNAVFIMLLLGSVFNFDMFLDLNIFPGNYLNKAFSGILTLYLPFAIINYYLIFYKKRHAKYTENRRINTGGKALLIYFTSSVLLVLLLVIVGKLIV
jgi:hypothetical protein